MPPTLIGSPETATLDEAQRRIRGILSESESAIASVAGCFEALARESAAVQTLSGEIIDCIQGEGVRSMLPRIQALGNAAKGFIHQRLEATSGVLEMVISEASLLERLAQLTRGQRSIARETQTLSVLTNIEVARLGVTGSGFQYLAHQLDEFSLAVAQGTKELSTHTEERQQAIAETRKRLTSGLPRIQKEFARIESDLESALLVADNSHRELAQAPEQFQAAVSGISSEISGVVAAVQGHDITRQQLEHVSEALQEVTHRFQQNEAESPDPMIAVGLQIQVWQLRSIEQTVSGWLARIRSCSDNILRISTSELLEIAPAVLRQERELSEQLTRIERLEQECEADSAEVQNTFSSLNNLMQLVGEHVDRAHTVRERLQLLTFNSIIEASHLGTQADAILEISQSIKRIAEDWSKLTDSSAAARDEILLMVESAQNDMQSFSAEGSDSLRIAQEETRQGLQNLRIAADFASGRAEMLATSTAALQSRVSAIDTAREKLENCFASLDAMREELDTERARRAGESHHVLPQNQLRTAESIYGANYTTELEREVLRAALSGGELPIAVQSQEGNDVELF